MERTLVGRAMRWTGPSIHRREQACRIGVLRGNAVEADRYPRRDREPLQADVSALQAYEIDMTALHFGCADAAPPQQCVGVKVSYH